MEEIEKINGLKILLLVLLFVVLSFFIPSNTYAWSDSSFSGGISIGYKTTSSNKYKLINTADLYCVWKRRRFGFVRVQCILCKV